MVLFVKLAHFKSKHPVRRVAGVLLLSKFQYYKTCPANYIGGFIFKQYSPYLHSKGIKGFIVGPAPRMEKSLCGYATPWLPCNSLFITAKMYIARITKCVGFRSLQTMFRARSITVPRSIIQSNVLIIFSIVDACKKMGILK